MKMYFTSISKLHSSWYMSAVFQSNVDCLNTVLPDLGIVHLGLVRLIWFSTSLTTINATLVISLAACIIACAMFCSVDIYCLAFLKNALYESACFLFSSMFCVRLLTFYSWHCLMLLASRKMSPLVASDHLIYVICLAWLLYLIKYVQKCIYTQFFMCKWCFYRYVSMCAIGCYMYCMSLSGYISLVICIYVNIV